MELTPSEIKGTRTHAENVFLSSRGCAGQTTAFSCESVLAFSGMSIGGEASEGVEGPTCECRNCLLAAVALRVVSTISQNTSARISECAFTGDQKESGEGCANNGESKLNIYICVDAPQDNDEKGSPTTNCLLEISSFSSSDCVSMDTEEHCDINGQVNKRRRLTEERTITVRCLLLDSNDYEDDTSALATSAR